MITLEKLMHDGRSLIYNVNNTGPRMLPCGTPFSTARGTDRLLPNDTTSLEYITWKMTAPNVVHSFIFNFFI
jgi:hypothetical protein